MSSGADIVLALGDVRSPTLADALRHARHLLARHPELYDTCSEPECALCSMVMCARHDLMHLHHDGCPSCEPEDYADEPAVGAEGASDGQ